MQVILILALTVTSVVAVITSDYRSPSFVVEPSSLVEFTNNTGIVVPCAIEGHPSPTTSWILRGGSAASNIRDLRQTRHDGSLVFLPFSAEDYRADVHAAVYRCVGSNSVGTVESRDVQVRAVVLQRYEIRLFDEFVVRGNMAVLRCPVPGLVSDYIVVTGWERNDGFLATPDIISSKYGMFTNGDLYIRETSDHDNSHSFRCQTENRLTKERKVSTNFAKVIVTEPHHTQAPKLIWRSGIRVTVRAGKRATLSCAAQGYPVPKYRWHKNKNDGFPVQEMSHLTRQEEGVLVFSTVKPTDAGKYYCTVSNPAGQEKVETELVVEDTLRVLLIPSEARVDIGDTVLFNCSVEGSKATTVLWKKDGKSFPSDGLRVYYHASNILEVRRAQRKDAGIYQCFVNSEMDSAQAATRLIIGDISPSIITSFTEKTVSSGVFVSLSCTATGNPVPQIKWYLDGIWPLATRTNFLVGTYFTDSGDAISFVNVTSTKVTDGGLYTCEASNEAGTQSHSQRLNIVGPLMVRSLNNVTALASDTFRFLCPFAGYPFQSIRWKKEGRSLPMHQRQKVFPNGTFLIQDVQPDDGGHYSCEVISDQQIPAVGTFPITVRTKPKLAFFAFQDNLHEGMRTAVTCIVSAGDPPFTMRWMKDGLPLADGVLDVKIMYSEDGFVSTLTINNLAYRHNGNYTCLASNDVATGSHSTLLTVKVPPRWILEPRDTSAISSKPVIIDCQADGVPQPHVRWKMAAAGEHPPENFHTIVSSSNIHILVNGSLNFRNVEASDSGYYLCEANNGVGPGLSVVVKLTIHSAPQFLPKFLAINARRGDKVPMECEAKGDQPMSVSWSKNGSPLDLAIEAKYSETVEQRLDGKTSQLLLKKVDKKDTALFTCTAVNDYGEDSTNVQVTVQDIPEAPQNLDVHDVSSRSVRLTWNKPFHGNSPILSYTVVWRMLNGKSTGEDIGGPLVISGSETTATVRNLMPLKRYFFRVKCKNALGESQFGAESAVTTLDEPPRKPPTYVKAVPLSSSSVNVTWQNPKDDTGSGSVEGYYVGYKVRGSSQPYAFNPGAVLERDVTTLYHIVGSLKRYTIYSVIVQAYNSRGAGPPSEEIYVQTLEYDPPGGPVIQTFSATSKTIHLTWHLKSLPFAPISGYTLYCRTEGGEWSETHIDSNRTGYTVNDLLCGTVYHCYIVAYNNAGRGNASEIVTAKTDGNPPIAPDKRLLLTLNSTYAKVNLHSWYNGGCPISYFVIQYKASGSSEWTLVSNNIVPQQNNITISTLVPGSWYSLLMTAKNDAGTTDAEYVFATLTLTGEYPALPSEMNESGESLYRHLTITVPVLISTLVLTVVLCVVCLVTKRRSTPGYRSSTPDGADVNDAMKPEQLPLPVTFDNSQEPAYFPAPYATSRVTGYSRKQHCLQTEQNQDIGTFGSIRSGYSYDIPCPQRRLEKDEGTYGSPVVYFTSYHHDGIDLRTQAIYEVPHREVYISEAVHETRSWREAGDGNSSTESDTDELMYAVCPPGDRALKDEARESETECDRLWKTFQGSQYEAVTR